MKRILIDPKDKIIKKGDKVYCLTNHMWGKSPMIVTEIKSHNYICCKHPLFGDGGFLKQDLIKVLEMSKSRRSQLKEYNKYESLCNTLRKKLFGED